VQGQPLDRADSSARKDVKDKAGTSPAIASCPRKHPQQNKETGMRVAECMTRDVEITSPDQTIQEAARCMAEIDAGVLPVAQNDRLVGMITDRDIAVRAVADGKGCDAKVGEVMSREVRYCFEDDDSEDVLRNMGEQQLRRMPVLSRDKRLVGIISLSDCTADGREACAGEALHEIARPGGQHSQTLQ
jgi:CBS domain-containing protein